MKIDETEFLNELAESIRMRLEELSRILNNVKDATTRSALTNNHQKGMEELAKIKERIREIEREN